MEVDGWKPSNKRHDEEFNKYMWICFPLLGLNAALTGLTGLEIFFWASEGPSTVPYSQIRLPCGDLTTHPDDTFVDARVSPENDSLCYIANMDKLHSAIEQFVSRRVQLCDVQDDRNIRECTYKEQRGTTPSINLVGKTTKYEIDRNQTFTPLEWDIKSDLHHQNGHISYAGGYVQVREAGMYSIYAQVTFLHTDTPHTRSPYTLTIFHRPRFQSDYETMIADSRHVDCRRKSDTGTGSDGAGGNHVTTYVSIVYWLKTGARVRIKVHAPGEIVPGAHLNVYGMHMVR